MPADDPFHIDVRYGHAVISNRERPAVRLIEPALEAWPARIRRAAINLAWQVVRFISGIVLLVAVSFVIGLVSPSAAAVFSISFVFTCVMGLLLTRIR